MTDGLTNRKETVVFHQQILEWKKQVLKKYKNADFITDFCIIITDICKKE